MYEGAPPLLLAKVAIEDALAKALNSPIEPEEVIRVFATLSLSNLHRLNAAPAELDMMMEMRKARILELRNLVDGNPP